MRAPFECRLCFKGRHRDTLCSHQIRGITSLYLASDEYSENMHNPYLCGNNNKKHWKKRRIIPFIKSVKKYISLCRKFVTKRHNYTFAFIVFDCINIIMIWTKAWLLMLTYLFKLGLMLVPSYKIADVLKIRWCFGFWPSHQLKEVS